MDSTGLDIDGGYNDPQHVRTLTQDEWDEANAIAQGRQGRARQLAAAHRRDYQVTFPPPEPLPHPITLDDATFAKPDQILERVRGDGLFKRRLSPSLSPEDHVDWSECVERSSTETNDAEDALTFDDLRQREIDLRGGRISLDHSPRPLSLARAKRPRALQK